MKRGRTMASQVLPLLVRRLGDQGRAAAQRLGLPADVAERGELVVPLAQLDGYCEVLASTAGDPLFAWRLGAALPRGAYGLIEMTTRAAPTLDVALERFSRFSPLLNDQILVEWSRPRLRHSIPGVPDNCGRHCNEFYVALVAWLVGQMSPGTKPGRVMFAHARHAHSEQIERALGCPVDWGVGANVLDFPAARLEAPLATADAALFRVLDEVAAQASLQRPGRFDVSSRVTALLPELLPGRGSLIERAAARLRMSGRTLQRRLEAEGVVFAELVEQHRRELALNLARDEKVALSDIAYRLGYSEPRAFIRAFKAWEGRTPGDVRSAAR